jgi:hypothetical protein
VEDRLLPVNGLLGLVTRHDFNEPLLANGGFELAGLEVPVTVGAGKVVIDVLLFHPERSILLACEAKSGSNIETSQARRYEALDASDVVLAANITLSKPVQPSVVPIYACLCDNIARIRQGLRVAELSFPIIGVCREHISFDLPEDAHDTLRRALPARSLRLDGPPVHVIEFDQDSPVSALLPAVRAQLVTALASKRERVSTPWLAEQTARYLAFYARAARQKLVRTIGEAARLIAESDAATFEYHGPTANDAGYVRLLKTPEDNDPRGRTQAYQALARSSQPRRKKTRPHDPDQLDLLRELMQADDEEDHVADEGEGLS